MAELLYATEAAMIKGRDELNDQDHLQDLDSISGGDAGIFRHAGNGFASIPVQMLGESPGSSFNPCRVFPSNGRQMLERPSPKMLCAVFRSLSLVD